MPAGVRFGVGLTAKGWWWNIVALLLLAETGAAGMLEASGVDASELEVSIMEFANIGATLCGTLELIE